MESMEVIKFFAQNASVLIGTLIFSVLVLVIILCYLLYSLSSLKSAYQKMMTGEETGLNLEKMLMQHIASTEEVRAENQKIKEELEIQDEKLKHTLSKVGVVRFCAFQDMGSDLSFALALLDEYNNGVIISSIFGREDSRTYVKPIENLTSKYTLTKEEEEALKNAKNN